MRDLEIRGAGSLLGAEQSGHIGAVGFELYTQMLGEAVEQQRAQRDGLPTEPPRRGPNVSIDLPLVAHVPESYVPDVNLRLGIYQELAAVEQPTATADLATSLVDRFGPIPGPVANLLATVRLRALAGALGAESLAREDEAIVLRLAPGIVPPSLDPTTLPHGVEFGRTLIRFHSRALGDNWLTALEAALHTLTDSNPAGPSASVTLTTAQAAPEPRQLH
jgi:transcription-repair coupling factor (superfamily II helicase)